METLSEERIFKWTTVEPKDCPLELSKRLNISSPIDPELFRLVKSKRVPAHIAVIMDGNRRWAKTHGLSVRSGHISGASVLPQIIRMASHLGVKTLTTYAFSTENWERSKNEVHDLFELFDWYLKDRLQMMLDEGVALSVIGQRERLPSKLNALIDQVQRQTSKGKKLNLVLAIDYGSRNEITRAVRSIAEDVKEGILLPSEITEADIASRLDTAPFGDPEMFIRTSGESRLSNFLLWQMSYAEVHICDSCWPEFTPQDLLTLVRQFQMRDRRFGGS